MNTAGVASTLWFTLAALGLTVTVSYARMPLVGQSAFVAVGAYGVALLGPGGAGLPLGLALLTAVAAGAVLGYLVGFLLSHTEPAYFALGTWAIGWLMQATILAVPSFSGGSAGLSRAVPVRLVSRTLGVTVRITYDSIVVIAAVACAVVLAGLARCEAGPGARDLAASRWDPRAGEALGIPVARRRRAVIALTAAIGAAAGCGLMCTSGVISPDDVSPFVSLQLFAAVVVGGTARWWGPLIGVAILAAVPRAVDAVTSGLDVNGRPFQGLLTAVMVLGALSARSLPGRPSFARRSTSVARRPAEEADDRSEREPEPPARSPVSEATRPELLARDRVSEFSADGLVVRYGPVTALDDVSITLRRGEVHAVVGANGSGKSTLLSVLAGELNTGVVRIDGRVDSGRSQVDRVRAGIARTQQNAGPADRLPVADQIAIAVRGSGARRFAVLRHLLATPLGRDDERGARSSVSATLSYLGLADRSRADPAVLTAGERARLTVGRAIATGASVLLFDEPAAGLSTAERAEVARLLRRLADEGSAVLLVEHDMRFVTAIADRLTVLSAGRQVATGPAAEVLSRPAVVETLLGRR